MPHKFWEFIIYISGRGMLNSAGSDISFEGGMVFLVPPGTPHREQSEEIVDSLWIGLQGTALKNPMISKLTCIKNKNLIEQAKDLWLFSEKGGLNIGPELDGMTLSLINRYFRNLTGGTVDSGSFMDKAINYFDAHFTEEISISDVADACDLSKGHFARLFKKASGKSPIEYLMSVRIRNANRLLENTTLTVREISELSGYQNEFYFSRAFKKISGMSPSQYRLNCRPSYCIKKRNLSALDSLKRE